MNYKIEACEYICGLKHFVINGVEADKSDFVEQYDDEPGMAPEYGCGNMRAHILSPTEQVLKKYNINENEYMEIAEKIAELISFGYCSLCA